MRLSESVVIVTGAGSGIGKAIANRLSECGAKIVLVDANESVQQAVAGKHIATLVGDVTCADIRKKAFEIAEKEFGRVNAVIPAAGITRDALSVKLNKETGNIDTYTEDNFDLVINVNLKAPVYWAMEMAARIAKSRKDRGLGKWCYGEGPQGAVVFIGSVSSQGNAGQISYSITKKGLVAASETFNKEWKFHGIRTSVVHPGFTDTPMVGKMKREIIEAGVLPYTQIGRLIRPDEIANAVVFALTNDVVTGEIWVDGGWHSQA